MLDKENDHYTQPERRRRTKGTDEKWNRILNYLITLVVILIGVTVVVIWQSNSASEESTLEKTTEQLPTQKEDATREQDEPIREQSPDEKTVEEVVEQVPQEESKEPEEQTEVQVEENSSEQVPNTIVTKGEGNVKETWTNETWQAVPTAQTGEHRSVYEEGHIDYEEKLAAIFSILPIDLQSSVIWSVRNNGSAESARAIVSANPRGQGYEVFIKWENGVGWKPVQVNVLKEVKGS